MRIKPSLLLLAAAFLPLPLWATTVEFNALWYLRIDGRNYSVDAGTIGVGSNHIALGSLPASLTNCRRASGAIQPTTGAQLTYAAGGVVYLASEPSEYPIHFDSGAAVLDLVTATGDVICDGERLSPAALAQIFSSGFE